MVWRMALTKSIPQENIETPSCSSLFAQRAKPQQQRSQLSSMFNKNIKKHKSTENFNIFKPICKIIVELSASSSVLQSSRMIHFLTQI